MYLGHLNWVLREFNVSVWFTSHLPTWRRLCLWPATRGQSRSAASTFKGGSCWLVMLIQSLLKTRRVSHLCPRVPRRLRAGCTLCRRSGWGGRGTGSWSRWGSFPPPEKSHVRRGCWRRSDTADKTQQQSLKQTDHHEKSVQVCKNLTDNLYFLTDELS